MDSSGYQTRAHPHKERNVGGTHGLDLIFFIIQNAPIAVPTLSIPPALLVRQALGLTVLQTVALAIAIPVLFVLSFALGLVILSRYDDAPELADGADWKKHIVFKDANQAKQYLGLKIPMGDFIQAYLKGEVDFIGKDPVRTLFEERRRIFRFVLGSSHLSFFTFKLMAQTVHHSQKADTAEVRDVYERGNDFYRWFLGPRMVYTSGVWEDENETLEQAQDRKLDIVCRKMQLQPGEELLDIGCGWGTLVCHAAKHYGVKATGVTLAREQREWLIETNAPEYGVTVGKEVEMLIMDYRDIPKGKQYDKISCLEMAEHVGIKRFQDFLLQVKDLLKDDGIFYMQIAGLRRAWQFEDFVWGLFMGTYIFPAADASCPLAFVVGQCERAGFEVHSVENCGVHYALTIHQWAKNWLSNKEAIVKKYGDWWYRLWVIFLCWSAVIATQGCSTVFFITLHKNTSRFDRKGKWVGKYPIATQQ